MPGGLTLGFAMHLLCFVTMVRKRLRLSIEIYELSSIKHCIIKYQVLQIWCVSRELMPWNHRKLPRFDDLGVSDMKGLISWVAQQISTVTRLIHDKHAPDYQKQERKTLSDQTRFTLVANIATAVCYLFIFSCMTMQYIYCIVIHRQFVARKSSG